MSVRTIFLLGPCCKLDRKTGRLYPPFDEASRSGQMLRRILATGSPRDVVIVFDNILPTPNFDRHGRECVPKFSGLVVSLRHHRLWKEAHLVVGFGSEVRAALEYVSCNGEAPRGNREPPAFLFLQHPSYVMRRPADERAAFADALMGALQ